jgi:TonB family protein
MASWRCSKCGGLHESTPANESAPHRRDAPSVLYTDTMFDHGLRRIPLIALLLLFTGFAQAQNAAAVPTLPFISLTSLSPIDTPQPVYPVEAKENGIQGDVEIRFTISKSGTVEAVDVISGDRILADAVVNAVRKWKYKPYELDGAPIAVRTHRTFSFSLKRATTDNHDPSAVDLATSGVPKRIRLSAAVSQGRLVHQVRPEYPSHARFARIQGTVVVAGVIGKDGKIHDLHVVRGHPLLATAAETAVSQWRYKPYLMNGEPVEVETEFFVSFSLP